MIDFHDESFKDFEAYLLNPKPILSENETFSIRMQDNPFSTDNEFSTDISNVQSRGEVKPTLKPLKISNKKYQPIVENSILYSYEANPSLYKKIRK